MVCKNCGKEFTEKYSKWSNGDFCSKFCAHSFVSNKINGTKKINCVTCGKEIEVDKRASDKLCKCDKCRGYKKSVVKRLKKCLNCNKNLGYKNKRFCNYKCQHDFEYKIYIEKWKNKEVSGNIKTEENLSGHIRRYLFEKFESKCSNCSWNEVNEFTGNIPLEVEHIDGNAKNSFEENLTLLCPNCHSLTKTSKGANRGNGRIQRKLRDRKYAAIA